MIKLTTDQLRSINELPPQREGERRILSVLNGGAPEKFTLVAKRFDHIQKQKLRWAVVCEVVI